MVNIFTNFSPNPTDDNSDRNNENPFNWGYNYQFPSDKKWCNQDLCKEMLGKYGGLILPKCPALKDLIKKHKLYSYNPAPKIRTNYPLWDSIRNILLVLWDIINLKPDYETEVIWAHCDNLLTERLDLIKDDLSALPQSLEGGFLRTSQECGELCAELKLAEDRYLLHGQSLLFVPYYQKGGNYETFLQWRERRVNLPNLSDRIEMLGLTRHYPAEAIKVMQKFYNKLFPLAKTILPQKAMQEHKQLLEMKEIITKSIIQQSPGKGGGKKNDSKRKKTPLQFLKEARERQAAKELAKQPNITSRELGKILECNASTVTRLDAWQKKEILKGTPPNGFIERNEDGETSIEAIETDK
jgi:hypothetical protein